MQCKKMSPITKIVFILLTIVDLVLYLFTSNTNFILFATVIVFVGFVLFAVKNLDRNIFILCFLICFFTFLLGGQILNRLFDVYYYDFSEEIESRTDILLFISIIGLLLGYLIASKINIRFGKNKKNVIDYDSGYIMNVRKLSKLFFLATYLLWMITLLDIILYVMQNGYVSYYINYSSRVPSYIRQVAYMCPTAFFLFLATMPKRKEVRVPVILYMIYTFLSLLTGRRVNFITGLMIVFAYYMCRNKINNEGEAWISKKMIYAICISLPLLLSAMYLFEYIRADQYVGNSSDYSPIVGFFVRQGTSINVIKYTERFKDGLNPDAMYSLYNTIRWLQGSFLNDLLALHLDFEIGNQSIQTALNGTYLADFVSYKANASIYTQGMGYGSCYIEELYVDFGYVGVILGNILYGIIFQSMSKNTFKYANVWKTAISFIMLNYLFQAPRSVFDAFFGKLLYPDVWLLLLVVFLVSYVQKMNMLGIRVKSIERQNR